MSLPEYTALFLVLMLLSVVISYPIALLIKTLEGLVPRKSVNLKAYFVELIAFNVAASVISFAIILRYSAFSSNISLAINAIASYITGTNLQHFAGETTLTYFGFLTSLGLLQWVAPITGMAVAISLISSITDSRVGDFLINAVISTIVFAILTIIFTVIYTALGVPMSLNLQASGIRPGPLSLINSQTLLGNNGGPYFSSGFYLPLTNPGPLSTMLYIVEMAVLPFSFIWLFGVKLKRLRVSVMLLFSVLLALILIAITSFQRIPGYPLQVGNSLSNAFMAVSMGTNTGATLVNLYSLSPIQSSLYLILMVLGNSPGSAGAGFVELVFIMVLSLFFVGLMSGRLPYFLGRRLNTKEVAVVSIAFLSKPILVYLGVFLSIILAGATYHAWFGLGFTEMLWEVVSSVFNNGSDFYGPYGNTIPLNWITSALMIAGRYITIFLGLYLSFMFEKGAVKREGEAVVDVGSLRFAIALFVFNFILNVLSIFPLLALGPLA